MLLLCVAGLACARPKDRPSPPLGDSREQAALVACSKVAGVEWVSCWNRVYQGK